MTNIIKCLIFRFFFFFLKIDKSLILLCVLYNSISKLKCTPKKCIRAGKTRFWNNF